MLLRERALANEFPIVRSVGSKFVHESVDHFSFRYGEGSWHLKPIAKLLISDPVALHNSCLKSSDPGLQAKELVKISLQQSESLIVLAFRVAHMRYARQPVFFEVLFGDVVGGHVHENCGDSFLAKSLFVLRDVG